MDRAYQKIRKAVEAKGGSITHEKKGFPLGGVWIVKLNKTKKIFYSTGGLYPKLDKLYVLKPGVKKAKSWNDYTNEINLKELNKFFKKFS
jgi:hypothetical protein